MCRRAPAAQQSESRQSQVYSSQLSQHIMARTESSRIPAADHYGNVRISMEVTQDNFLSLLEKYDVLLLNFHAPWCPHCQRRARERMRAGEEKGAK